MIRFVMGADGHRTVVIMTNNGGINANLDDIRVIRGITVDEDVLTGNQQYSLQVKTLTDMLFVRYDEPADMQADLLTLRQKILEPVFNLQNPMDLSPLDQREHVHAHQVHETNIIDASTMDTTYYVYSYTVAGYRIQHLTDNRASLVVNEGPLQYTITDTLPVIDALMRAVQDSQMIAMENLPPC